MTETSQDVELLAVEQAALRRVATLVASGVEPGPLFDALAGEVEALFGADISAVVRFEADGTVTVMGAHRGPHSRGARVHLDQDYVVAAVSRTGQSAAFDLQDWDAEPPAVVHEWGVRSAVATPVVVEGEVWGAFTIASLESSLAAGTDRRLADFSALFATAIANAQSREALAALAEEQAALRRVATLAARELAPVDVLVAVTDEAARTLKSEAVGMLRFEHDASATLVAQSQTPWDPPPLGSRFALEGENVVAWVHRTGQTARMDDWTKATGPVAALAHELGVSSAVATPIIVQGRLWGTMVAVTSQSEPLPADIESRIGEFTELVATAIANAQSRETLAELAEEQAALRRVAMLVAHDAPPSEIFSAVSEEVARVFDSAAGVLQFEHGSAVVFVGVANIDVPVGARWEFQEGMTSTEVYRTGRPARVEGVDWSSLGGEVGEVSRRHGTRSIVGSPILVEGRLWGTIVVSSRHDLLPPDTEERLERFTDLIGTAIANAETRRTRAQLAEEQAALRRVATLVAEGVPAAELFSAVTKEVARVFSDVDPSLVASVIRFDPGPESVLVGASRPDEREPIGSRWAPKDLYVSTRVLRTGGCARVDEADLEAMGGSDADVLRLRGFLHQVGSPVVVEGRLWGSMTLNSTEALPPDVDQRLASFVDLVATAIANADSRSELAASRKRLVAASDEARRRIERDLHDGTQQRLVSLALAARAAEAQLPTESRDVREKFSKIAIGLAQAVEELQELSRGIHPAILSDAGLGPALEALALRSPIPVELRVHTQERYPEPVEVAAYFVASESLANAAKHSQASHIDVALTLENGRLLLSVCDDGIGGADPGRGSGLVGLRDRVEAVGGSLEIKSESGDGTLLVATLPIRDELGADADRFP